MHFPPLQQKNQMEVGALTFSCSIKPAKLDVADLRNKFSDSCAEGGTRLRCVDEKTEATAGLRQQQREKNDEIFPMRHSGTAVKAFLLGCCSRCRKSRQMVVRSRLGCWNTSVRQEKISHNPLDLSLLEEEGRKSYPGLIEPVWSEKCNHRGAPAAPAPAERRKDKSGGLGFWFWWREVQPNSEGCLDSTDSSDFAENQSA